FFAQIEAAVPADVATKLKWITRSLGQKQRAEGFAADLRARIISYADVIIPGQVEVYAPGTTAGRLLIVRAGEEALLNTARATDVLVVEAVPDFLPPCAALITAEPQTALAHVNLLARNRGIPNAFRGGVSDDPNLDQLARVRAPVIVRARGNDGDDGTLEIVAMSESNFATWRTLTSPPTITIPEIDVTDLDDTVDLATLSIDEADELRPVIGGKAAGFVALITAGVSTVDAPMAITIKPYVEHFDETGLQDRLTAMLADTTFAADSNVRRIVLLGEGAVNASVAEAFKSTRPAGNVLRDLVEDGGVVDLIKNTPIAAARLSTITDALLAKYGRYARDQGLRFRSSSTIEDAAGFNGAGLYESNTGYLDPRGSDDSVEDAIRATWSSYWGFEAFEERRLSNVDHLKGAMAVVVHANFPDRIEVNNGVAIFTLVPSGDQDDDAPAGYVLEVNQQAGALSVTNPPPGSPHLPEIDRVSVIGDGAPTIERVRASTVLLPGNVVLDDATLLAMFDDARTITEQWLAADNADLAASKQRTTLTLDFETRTVAAGWPALRSGVQLPSRLVWKQARPLEPASSVPSSIAGNPIPRDVLARARRVEEQRCTVSGLAVAVTSVFTDAAIAPDMGYAVDPFVSFLFVDALSAQPAIDAPSG
ncbi:MAG TPA: PEP/pyruvate-binding domain-containing protein, partial [Myxococcota bacterium]